MMPWQFNLHSQIQEMCGFFFFTLYCFNYLDLMESTCLKPCGFLLYLQDSTFSSSKSQSYFSELIAASPSEEISTLLPVVPQLQNDPRVLPLRIAAMFKVLVSVILIPDSLFG